ncbi:MAG: permease [Spirochaetales bacterium]|nr:permease [Spirochaetales bacterium]
MLKQTDSIILAAGGTDKRKIVLIQIVLIACILLALLDFGYKLIYNINPANKQQCVVYKLLPEPEFILFENLIELPMIIFLSIFAGLFLQRLFYRLRFPILHGPFRTFLTASLLPICSCSSVSLLSGMGKIFNIRNTVIFFITAPLLNPFIILMSINLLGIKYCLLRIIGTFLLSFSTGFLIHFLHPKIEIKNQCRVRCTRQDGCVPAKLNPFVKGTRIFKGLIPFVLFGAGLSITFSFLLGNPLEVMKGILQSFMSKAGIVLLGIPLYICGGADILILKPLMHAGLPLGSALSFSLTAAAVCIPSLLMLSRLLGKKTVLMLTVYLVLFSFCCGEFINMLV